VQSVLDQGYEDFVIVVSDNASADDTCQVVKAFDDPRIHYIRRDENHGAHDNINFVIAQAQTEFVVLLPDDDGLLPGGLARAVDLLDRYPNVGYVHSSFDVIDSSGHLLEKSMNWFFTRGYEGALRHGDWVETGAESIEHCLGRGVRVAQATAVFRRDLLPETPMPLTGDDPQPDLYLYLDLGLRCDVAFIDQPGGIFRRYDESARTPDSHWQVLADGRRVFREDIALRDRDLKLAWIAEHQAELPDADALRQIVANRSLAALLYFSRVEPTRTRSFQRVVRAAQLQPGAVRDKRTWRRLVGSLRRPRYPDGPQDRAG
jgi:glycosyltransferase involved in cell wall biosynthesis